MRLGRESTSNSPTIPSAKPASAAVKRTIGATASTYEARRVTGCDASPRTTWNEIGANAGTSSWSSAYFRARSERLE